MTNQINDTQSNDPIETIKRAEKESHLAIEDAKKESEDRLRRFEEDLENDRLEFEESLRKRGKEELEKAKSEASGLLKDKMLEAQNETVQTKNMGESKLPEAIGLIKDNFFEYVKK